MWADYTSQVLQLVGVTLLTFFFLQDTDLQLEELDISCASIKRWSVQIDCSQKKIRYNLILIGDLLENYCSHKFVCYWKHPPE